MATFDGTARKEMDIMALTYSKCASPFLSRIPKHPPSKNSVLF